ncbi:MAG: hypothetical protein QXN93_07510 [Methanomassiliicoccales archaeon]
MQERKAKLAGACGHIEPWGRTARRRTSELHDITDWKREVAKI